jgi:ATP-binding cassette, subfamily B, bacterial HlyB/CyaB
VSNPALQWESERAQAPGWTQDSGLLSLILIAKYHDLPIEEAILKHRFGHERFDSSDIVLAARSIGLKSKRRSIDISRLERVSVPAIASFKDGNFVIVASVQLDDEGQGRVLIQQPEQDARVISLSTFRDLWTGEMLLFAPESRGAVATPFGFSWFIPSIRKYRRLLAEVLLVSFAIQLIALATPLCFQIVMDKVLVNRAMSTLDVVCVVLLIATVFDTVLTAIRSYVFAHTTSKIDVELGARLFRHLLALPITYFQARRTGDSVARVRELENIRSFLTSNALTLVLDLFFSAVFLVVMFWYSRTLSFILLASIPVYVAISVFFTPLLRQRLNDKFNKGSESQSFLVEAINGLDTIKTMAVEPRWTHRWDQTLASYVRSSLRANNVGMLAGGAVNLTGKLVTLLLLWFGAKEVMSSELTLGEFIAFNMLAGQVASPIIRMAQLWNDYQQVGVSIRRLADILNAPQETTSNAARLPRLQGRISFADVWFKYQSDRPYVLRDVSFEINPGEVIGIVGASGSGKSTLARLIQRLYIPEQGRISMDGLDVATVDVASLRMQVGVVPQENVLFNRSIRGNIALSRPGASLEEVVRSARLAGAHDFICSLPQAYESIVGEHGSNLSGGQRQRIAIARALMQDPRILIFDEATSALDYESERAIQQNMNQICQRRTVLIIAHRLSTVRHADRIFVLEKGQLVESGSHEDLLRSPIGLYSRLFHMQHDGSNLRVV